MKILKLSSQFKKDLKHIQHNPKKIEKLKTVLELLKESGTVPPEYQPHLLVGQYKGYMECHIEGDFLLIWIDQHNLFQEPRLG